MANLVNLSLKAIKVHTDN